MRKTEKIDGCLEAGYADGWCDRERYWGRGEMKTDDSLWQPVKGAAKRRSS